jgi:hypothetical protein
MKDDRFPPKGTDESVSKRGEETGAEAEKAGRTDDKRDSSPLHGGPVDPPEDPKHPR